MPRPSPTTRIRALIAEQRYVEAEALLREYAADAVSTFHSPDEWARAIGFVRECLQTIKAQRAHDAARLADLKSARAYTQGAPQASLDVCG